MEHLKEQIVSFDKRRYDLLDKESLSSNEEKFCDMIARGIERRLIYAYESMSVDFEFIMYHLSRLGQCPNLLNDDNGHWAVSGDGLQNVVYGDELQDVETHFMVEAKDWKNSPREALLNYLKEGVDE